MTSNMTPMMRQYYELKEQVGDAVLFFRMGDFYEMFDKDAETVAPKLGLVLTSREKGDAQRVPFCGVPHHSSRTYWLKLLKLGHKVAIAEQVEDPKEVKGLVRREVIKTLTPGCIDDLDALSPDLPNYLLAALEDEHTRAISVVLADVSTGELRVSDFLNWNEVCELALRYQVRQMLVRQFHSDAVRTLIEERSPAWHIIVDALPEAPLRDSSLRTSMLQQTFGEDSLAVGFKTCRQIDAVVSGMLGYLNDIHAPTGQFRSVKPIASSDCLSLSETVIRDLEIFSSIRRNETDGSLFKVINHCMTPMGARYLRQSLMQPFADVERIGARQKLAMELASAGEIPLGELRSILKSVLDLPRLLTRVIGQSATPRDLLCIRNALQTCVRVSETLSAHKPLKNVHKTLGLLDQTVTDIRDQMLDLLNRSIAEHEAGQTERENLFKAGFDAELDELMRFAQCGEDEITTLEQRLRGETGISSLKVRHHKSFGHLIEITKSNLSRAPKEFIRRQTMVNCERFVTDELRVLSSKIENASALLVAREGELYRQLLTQIQPNISALQTLAEKIGQLDLGQNFAWMHLRHGYCFPEVSKSGDVSLRSSRHPVVECFVGRSKFIPNDINIASDRRMVLVTGPNMAGKSTCMRQVALSIILHQMGAPIPATQAELPVFDGLFTRIGASDDLARGQSTFMVEMSEAATILRQSTSRSFVVLDEIGRGTSSQDGLAIATAILESLVQTSQCFGMFSTHYHEMVKLSQGLAGVDFMQVEVQNTSSGIKFTHRLVPGSASSSYGIEVGKLAGLPSEVISRCNSFLEHINLRKEQSAGVPTEQSETAQDSTTKLGHEEVLENKTLGSLQLHVVERLKSLRINRLTPLEALNILNDLKESLGAKKSHQDVSLFDMQ
jgi:DNA mismatch repair protein MutS